MKLIQNLNKLGCALIVSASLTVVSATSNAATINLVAEEAEVAMPDGVIIPMWGFFTDTGQACNPATTPSWNIGPEIRVPAGDNILQINLRNCLDSAATSIIISGEELPVNGSGTVLPPDTTTDAQGRIRVTSFTSPVATNTSSVFTWNNLTPGTYLYQSGTHPALQVQMGLYGAMVKDLVDDTEAYPGVTYDQDLVFLYSEIAPDKHMTPSSPKPLDYRPSYFLVNGQPFTGQTLAAGAVQQNTLLRFLNAGLKDHVPAISSGHLQVVAEGGNQYPYPRDQYTLQLAAGKVMDAVFTPMAAGNYIIYDRSLHLTTAGVTNGGLMSRLSVADAGTPFADAGGDQRIAVTSLVLLDGSASFDSDNLPNPTLTYSWTITSLPVGSTATLSNANIVNPTFTADIAGNYSIDLVVNDGANNSTPDNVIITAIANQAPIADAGDDSQVNMGDIVTLDGSGSNDSDNFPDPQVTYLWSMLSVPAGSNATLPDPTLVNPTFTADLAGAYTIGLIVNDGMDSSSQDSVVVAAITPTNIPPVAIDDAASTSREVPVTINLVLNDSDTDGSVDATTVSIVNQPTRGSSVANMTNGTVIYTPRRGFRGTETFTYTVNDNEGATSNEATVRVNVVK